MQHKTVFREKAIELMNIQKGGIIVDLTLGAGGHSQDTLIELGDEGKLYSFDLDTNAIENFKDHLKKEGFEVVNQTEKVSTLKKQKTEVNLINDNFINLSSYIESKVDSVLVDLGWSTDQLGQMEGLSYSNPEDTLDMRFDENLSVKASDLLNVLIESQLMQMFMEYADFSFNQAKILSKNIISFRKKKAFEKTKDLLQVIDSAFPVAKNNGKQNLARVFQSLRISVNMEMQNLKDLLNIFESSTVSTKRLVLITFHSGEERVVEDTFKKLVATGKAEFITSSYDGSFLRPSVEELTENLKARSAKLWAIQFN